MPQVSALQVGSTDKGTAFHVVALIISFIPVFDTFPFVPDNLSGLTIKDKSHVAIKHIALFLTGQQPQG